MTTKSSLAAKPLKKRKSKRVDIKAHNLARAIWRTKGYCEDCGRPRGSLKANGKPIQLQGAHIFGTGAYPKLGSDLRNGICLCAGCHMKWTNNPEWLNFIKQHPVYQYYGQLLKLANEDTKVNWNDRLELLTEIKQAIEAGEMTLEQARQYET